MTNVINFANVEKPICMMRNILFVTVVCLFSYIAKAQEANAVFRGTIYNKEYGIHITMNLYDKNVIVPEQEIFGEVDGYIASDKTRHVWTITSAEIVNDKTARIEAINNYGSEDFTAKLTLNRDGTYTMRHTGGSQLKFPVKDKWQKIPNTVAFER